MLTISEKEEETIIKGLRRGDNSAMRSFYDLYARYLTAVCQRYITDNDEVKDVLQEAFIKIFTHANSFETHGQGSLLAWAKRIVVNECLMTLRKRPVMETIDHEVVDNMTDEAPVMEDIPPEAMHRMIRMLPDGYRTVFNLYVFEHLTHNQIAKELGIKEDSSASQFSRAKRMLRNMANQYRRKGGQR